MDVITTVEWAGQSVTVCPHLVIVTSAVSHTVVIGLVRLGTDECGTTAVVRWCSGTKVEGVGTSHTDV